MKSDHHFFTIGNIAKVMGKGKKERMIPIGDTALDVLKKYLDTRIPQSRAMFLNKSGTRLSDRSVRNIINKFIERYYYNLRLIASWKEEERHHLLVASKI